MQSTLTPATVSLTEAPAGRHVVLSLPGRIVLTDGIPATYVWLSRVLNAVGRVLTHAGRRAEAACYFELAAGKWDDALLDFRCANASVAADLASMMWPAADPPPAGRSPAAALTVLVAELRRAVSRLTNTPALRPDEPHAGCGASDRTA